MLKLLQTNSGWKTPVKFGKRVLLQRLGQNRPLFATFFVTDRCNVRCDGCVYYDNLDDHVAHAKEETARALRILDAIADEGIPICAFAGGEPFLRKDLPQLLRHGHRRGLSLSLITNAMVLTDEGLAAADESCDAVLFSPHPPSELNVKHPVARYEESWVGFSRMRRALRRPALTCAITLSKHTAPVLDDILRRAVDAGADQIKYQPNFFPDQFPTPIEIDEVSAVIRKWSALFPGKFTDPKLFLEGLDSFFGPAPKVACTANRRFNIGVFLDGTVSACCPAHVPIGNLFEKPISELLRHELELKAGCFGCHRVDAIKALELCGDRPV